MNILQSNLLGQLELRRCWNSTSECPFRTQGVSGGTWEDVQVRCLALDRQDAALEWLRSAVTHADDMVTLRRLLADDARGVAWVSNHQVVDLIAAEIARRDLCLLISQRLFLPAPIAQSKAAPPPSIAMTPSTLHPRIEDVTSREVVLEITELTDDVNQARQAAALEEAARYGVPFCEVCERAGRQEATSASSAA